MPTQGTFSSVYAKPGLNNSYSGADIVATITPIGGRPQVFAEIQTISYSIYRPMNPVYALGRIGPKGVVRGQRMIAGSLIFTVFDRHVLKGVIESFRDIPEDSGIKDLYDFNPEQLMEMKKYMKTDEMPPFDINISFMNEYGSNATMNIYGVHVLSEGQTMSIEDMITENTMQYIAMDIDLMNYGSGADFDPTEQGGEK